MKGLVTKLMGGAALLLFLLLATVPGRNLFLGTPIEQNQIGLVLRSLGDRESQVANQLESELVVASRGPGLFDIGTVMLVFPLGVQAFEFSDRLGFESGPGQQLVCDSVGGAIEFDVVVHVRVNETLPDIRERLLAFVQAYQLRRFDGSADVLSDFVRERLRDVMREPFINWCASQGELQIMRRKAEVNQIALDYMNEEFNRYGLQFDMVSVSSAMRVSDAAKARLNQLVVQSTETSVLNRRNADLVPLLLQIQETREQGLTDAAAVLNTAHAESEGIRAAAEAYERTALINLLGADNFMRRATVLLPLTSMLESDVVIDIVPSDARIYIGENATDGED